MTFKNLTTKLIFATLILVFPLHGYSQSKFQLGVNLDAEGAFVNIINQNNRFSKATEYDSLGWPKSDFDLVLMDGRPATEWSGTIDDPESYRVDYSGRYFCSFKGQANINASGTSVSLQNKSYDANTNTTLFELLIGGFNNANHGLVFLNFSSTQRVSSSPTNTGITNLKVNRPGYPLNSSNIFTDEFLDLCTAADFDCYRFYNVQNIWEGEPLFPAKTQWINRKTPLDASQVTMKDLNGKRDAWCWEYIVELSNKLKKDIWINIHMSCDSVYVRNLALFLKQNLDPSINIYIENSNEVWSPTQATHGPYNQAEATFYNITFDQNYARRSAELSRWFGLVYGQTEINKKIRVILAGQHYYNGRSDIHLNFIKNNIGEPKNIIYANSTALYFGSTKESSTNPLDINEGMSEDIQTQISNTTHAGYRLNHITKAKTWELPGGCTSYEGGPHLPAGGGTSNLSNQILSHRTSKMQEILEFNYKEGWKSLDGGLAMFFTLNSAYNRYGCWGLTDDYTKPDRNYKMQAMRNIIGGTFGHVYNYSKNNIIIHPNPTYNELLIKNENNQYSKDQKFTIYNSLGEVVMENFLVNNQKINIASLACGVYYIRLNGGSAKFLKY